MGGGGAFIFSGWEVWGVREETLLKKAAAVTFLVSPFLWPRKPVALGMG